MFYYICNHINPTNVTLIWLQLKVYNFEKIGKKVLEDVMLEILDIVLCSHGCGCMLRFKFKD